MSEKTLKELSGGPKPAKPYEDFPLFAHASGRWAKKIRGKMIYFGRWDEPDKSLRNYLEQRDSLHSGRKPREEPRQATVKDCCNSFLNFKASLVETGELSKFTYEDYKTACDNIVQAFGKSRLAADLDSEDFAKLRLQMANKWGLTRLTKIVRCCSSVFKYCDETGLIERRPVAGPAFRSPSKSAQRRAKAESGRQDLDRETIARILTAANPCMRAMTLLGVNAGLGDADCGSLRTAHVNLLTGLCDFPRPKTGIQRRFVLWPETVSAIRDYRETRPSAAKPDDDNLVFLTKGGNCWNREGAGKQLCTLFRRLLEEVSPDVPPRIGFYSLRRTYETVASSCMDQPAIDLTMGHGDESMAATYRQHLGNDRLQRVAEHVRQWLFAVTQGKNPSVSDGLVPWSPVGQACSHDV